MDKLTSSPSFMFDINVEGHYLPSARVSIHDTLGQYIMNTTTEKHNNTL